MDNFKNNKENSRSRGENWSQKEKDHLIEIMNQSASASIIECKQTDFNTNTRKRNEWIKVQQKLEELSGKKRGIMQIKGFWRRLKLTAKSKRYKLESSHKAAITDSNILIKTRTLELIEEEYSLKINYQKKELHHQDTRQKLEIDLLLLEKEKKELEIKKLKDL